MEKKKTYQAPQMEQMECKVEKGFAGSGDQPGQLEEMTMGQDQSTLFN